jgi:hypothetical protein
MELNILEEQYKKDLEAVKENGWALQFVQNQTPEICLEAVKQNGYALEHVKNQTPELCLEAVKQNGNSLYYVKNQTPELCLTAVKQAGYALYYVQNQTPELCLEAVKQDGYALKFVNKDKIPYLFHNVLTFEEVNKYCSFLTEESWEKACLPFKSTLGNILFKVL